MFSTSRTDDNIPENSISNVGDSNHAELFLQPKESVHIPFKFLTFQHMIQVEPSHFNVTTNSMLALNKLEDDVITEDNNDGDAIIQEMNQGSIVKARQMDQALNNRNIKINFRIKRDMSFLAILDLTINQYPHIVNKTFRFTQPEHTFFKKSFILPQWPQLTNSQNQSGGNKVFVRCSDPNIICSSGRNVPGNPVVVFVKVACGSAPQVKNFFIAIYVDPRLSMPIEVWQVNVRVMQRVDIAGVQGQTVRFALMIRFVFSIIALNNDVLFFRFVNNGIFDI